MEPLAIGAVAVEWQFRCHGSEAPGPPWRWSCRSKDGTVVAESESHFRSLREAVADAAANGFRHAS
jgi:hypothetical protein